MDFNDILARWEALEKAKLKDQVAANAADSVGGGKKANAPSLLKLGNTAGVANAANEANATDMGKSGKAGHSGAVPGKNSSGSTTPGCVSGRAVPDAGKEPDARSVLESWLASHGVKDKDESSAREAGGSGGEGSVSGRDMSMRLPQARLDLHGLTAEEAEKSVRDFLGQCSRRRLENVLIVHGKGNHSAEGPILAGVVKRVLETSPLAGSHGNAHRSLGGRGATWVRIRKTDYFSR